MTRLQLHRNEYDRGWTRVLMLGLIVVLLGSSCAVMVTLVAVESSSGTFAPLYQARVSEWTAAGLRMDLPVAACMLLTAVFSALAVGAHSPGRGGILGFLTSLFNLAPLALGSVGGFADLRFSPVAWMACGLGAVLAFYVGDLGSCFCRWRMRRETAEDLLRDVVNNGGDDGLR